MARRKKPKNETSEQKSIRVDLDTISNKATRSEKTAWSRKMNTLVRKLSVIQPIEEEIIALSNKKAPLIDEVAEIRKLMVSECVHPYEYLEHKDTYVECKFCGKRLQPKKK